MKGKISRIHIIGLIFFALFLSLKVYYISKAKANNAFIEEVVRKNGDGSHYLAIAENIHYHNTFSDNNSSIPTQSATWRPPIWPATLSIFYGITNSPLQLIVCKSILELLLFIVVFLVMVNYGKYKSFLFMPFLILLVEPQYLKYSITFLSESYTSVLILLLVVILVFYKRKKYQNILIPIVSVLIILCHPVSIFFVLLLLSFYVLFNFKEQPKMIMIQSLIFLIIAISWPLRNHLTFNEGMYLTISQGATFSKGWNEKVITDFTNVDGDLADEYINMKYLEDSKVLNSHISDIQKSKLLKKATLLFMDQSTVKEKVLIVLKKIKSNLNPFPEKPKSGTIETLGTVFRLFYCFVFIQVFLFFIKRPKMEYSNTRHRIYLVVISILVGQLVMSSYIYTGLRFNSIYGLSLLFCFIYLNLDIVLKFFGEKSSSNQAELDLKRS